MQNNFPDKELIYDHLNKIMFSKGIFFLVKNYFGNLKKYHIWARNMSGRENVFLFISQWNLRPK